ncbi:biogenesis of lysosome-related organelles complex-1, subunit 2 [Reticulomyxa filosa]|uniref:Biogenesis of lysosome-related organelles complex-1, subunit 2 n=1 Tax=Reticulomyxa filosa TaxID=46433 RepID=X6PBZ8_RETFI|nr:biogenesis of lysosome-related organelles complex-1, subunit 2 [Reticulomyxa filosa]|eukprot:ETO35643.1 biogenesis of lysosome-related organelles complex-1, subunit 2 [Reticulomyxa filosa]
MPKLLFESILLVTLHMCDVWHALHKQEISGTDAKQENQPTTKSDQTQNTIVNTNPTASQSSKTNNQATKEQNREASDLASQKSIVTSVSRCLLYEIQSSQMDYNLLQELNENAAMEYHQMTDRAKGLLECMEVMNSQEEQLLTEFSKIGVIGKEVDDLEAIIQKLDDYTKNLQAHFELL